MPAISAVDIRTEGVWKLNSEKLLEGSVAPLPAGSVMTITRSGDHVLVHITDGRGDPVSLPIGGRPLRLEEHVSADGKTLTQTSTGADPQTGKTYRVSRVWQRQVIHLNR